MRLNVRHLTRYEYEPPAWRAALRLKLFPARFASQNPEQWSVNVNGEPVAPLFTGLSGDAETIWTAGEDVGSIEVIAEGVIDVQDSAGVVRGLVEAARPGVFLRTTPLTARSAEIEQLAARSTNEDLLPSLHTLSDLVRDAVDYVPESTQSATSAAEALKLGKGVCQDHAHIFISAARLRGVPARYVAGYLLAEGAEQTHAWAEAFVPDLGWVGFDPSNRQCPTDHYVRLCSGFDAADAAPLRGRVQTNSLEKLEVAVAISEVAGQQQQQ